LEVDTETVNPTLNLADDTGVTDDWLDPNDTDTDWETSNATITGVVDEGSTVRIQATNTTTNAVTTVTIDPENLTKVGDVWSYSHDLSALGDGEYSIVVSSLDVAGNAGISVTETMTLDTAISKPTLDLPDLLDTELNVGAGGEILFPNGTVAGPAMLSHLPGDFVTNEIDGYTRNNSLPLSGQAEPGSLVRITITKEGEAYPSPDVFVVTSDTGDWTYPTGVLPDGLYTFAVTSIDTAGNESQADALNVYVDAVPSRSAVITMADGIDSNNSTNDTSDTTPTFTLYGDSDSTYLLYLDGQADPVATGTFNSSSYTRITPDDLVANMDHTYKLVTVDRAGNVQVTNDFNFTIDTIAPEQQDNPIAVTGSSTIIDAVGADPMKIYTNDNDPTMTIKVEAGTQAYMTGFNNNEWLTDTDGDGFITFNIANILEEGSHSASVMFRDAAHNRDANEDLSFDLVVDTNKPATNIDLKRSSDLGFSNSDDVTSGDQLVLMGTILETGLGQADGDFTSDIADYSVVVTNTTAGTSETVSSDDITLNADGTWELTYGTDGTDLSSGDYTATLTAADLSGNTHSSSTSFTVDNDDANILHDPAVSLQEIGSSGYYILQEANYLPDGVDMSHYKYELTFYGKDGDGNNISLALGESSFNGDGGIEELVTPSIMSTYDHAGVKVIDYAGNETESDFLDLDATDVTFVAEVEASADISSINVSITGDTDGDNVDDVSLSAEVNVDGDGNWMFQFLANPLAEGEYTLHLEGLDSASDPVSVAGESTYDFSVLASELQSDEQEFSIGENPSGETPPVGGADGDIATDSVEIEASVHIDYVEGSIS